MVDEKNSEWWKFVIIRWVSGVMWDYTFQNKGICVVVWCCMPVRDPGLKRLNRTQLAKLLWKFKHFSRPIEVNNGWMKCENPTFITVLSVSLLLITSIDKLKETYYRRLSNWKFKWFIWFRCQIYDL